jgi:hypothetical protein
VQRHQESSDEQGFALLPRGARGECRVKPDVVIVDDKPEKHAEGAYYLEWREGTRRVRLSVGNDATMSSTRSLRRKNREVIQVRPVS